MKLTKITLTAALTLTAIGGAVATASTASAGSCPTRSTTQPFTAWGDSNSYFVVPEDHSVIATETDYGGPFCSMIWRDNLYATQFHPEKSQADGLRILQNFAELSVAQEAA